MLDPLKDESIVQKVGGRFKLSTLIQKRLVQINGGSRPLVDPGVQDKVTVVLKEVDRDKIFLDTTNEGKSDDYQGSGESMDIDLGDL